MIEPGFEARVGSAEGIAAATGAAGMLLASGFEEDLVAFSLIAALTPLLGWGVVGLKRIHGEVDSRILTAGFWLAQFGVLTVGLGYGIAAVAAAIDSSELADLAGAAGIAPGFLILLPIGLGLIGFVAWQSAILGSWRRILPSLTAAGGVLAPQLLLLGFIILGYVMWNHSRNPRQAAG